MKRLAILVAIIGAVALVVIIVTAVSHKPNRTMLVNCLANAEQSYNDDLKNNSEYTTTGDNGQDVYHVSSKNTAWIDQRFADSKQDCRELY